MAKPVEIEFLMRDKGLSSGIDNARKKMGGLTDGINEASKASDALGDAVKRVTTLLAGMGAAVSLQHFVGEVVSVRGEFQKLEKAFKNMLGSEEQATRLMEQLVNTAATTPFDLKGVADGAKQLLAYGTAAEDVNETLTRLGDIAAGLSIPLNDLVYLYGTTMTQGRMYTQDLRQFMGRGIPLAEELAKQFGVTKDKVGELVTAGKVGAEEFQKAIWSLTDAGSKFGGLMEEQSKTIAGQISNIKDSVEMMFNDLGKQSEGIISGVLSGVSSLVANYERVGRVLAGLVATYGTYKAAVMTVTAVQTLQTVGVGALTAAEAVHYSWLVIVEKAQRMLNRTMMANPYVLVATLIAAGVAALVSMKNETERMREAEEKYQATKQKTIEAEEEHKRKIEELCSIATDEALSTTVRQEALNKLEQKYPDIFAKYDTEYEKLRNLKKIKEEIAALEVSESLSNPVNELRSVDKRIKELLNKTKWQTEFYQDSYGASKSRQIQVSDRTRSEEAELKNLQAKRESLRTQIHKDNVNAYFENLTGIDNDTLEAQIAQRKNLLARMAADEKNYGSISTGNASLQGTFNRQELRYQLNKLESEVNRRGERRGSASVWVQQAKDEYDRALKEYNDFLESNSGTLTREEFEKQAKELKGAVDAAKKAYDAVAPSGSGDSAGSSKEQKARMDAEKKGQDELMKLRNSNLEQEAALMAEGSEKKVAAIEADYAKQKAEIEKQQRELAELNKKSGVTAVNAGGLTEEQQGEIDKALDLAARSRRKSLDEAYREELQYMDDYLKQYGTFQQQKLAIAEDYDRRIAEAGSQWEKKSLEAEKRSALQQVDVDALKRSIDWGSVFGDFGKLFTDQLQPTIDKLKAVTRTDEFRNAGTEDRQTLYNLIQELEKANTSWDSDIFGKLGNDLTAYQTALKNYMDAQEKERQATEGLAQAKEQLKAAESKGDDDAVRMAASAVEWWSTRLDESSAAVQEFGSQTEETTAALQASATRANNMFEALASSLSGLKSGSLQGIGESLMGLDKLFNNSSVTNTVGAALSKGFSKLFGDTKLGESVAQALGDSGLLGQIISAILSILDILKDGIGVLISDVLDTVFNAISGIIGNILNGQTFIQIGKSLKNGIAGILDGLTFGWFSSLFHSGNGKEVQELTDKLTTSNDRLRDSVDKLKDSIDDAAGGSAVSDYKEAYEAQQRIIEQTREILEAQMGYHEAHHSNAYYWNLSDEDYQKINALLGTNTSSLSDLYELTPEQMDKIRTYLVDVWADMMDQGMYDKSEYWEDYADLANTLSDLTEQINENLAQTSFESLRSSFLDTLMDMDADASDFADDFAEYMQQALLNYALGDTIDEQLKDWYESWAQAMQDNGGALTEKQIDAYRDEWDAMVEDALAMRDSIASITGYTGDSGTSQTGNAGGFTAMTQDQGTKLEGMFTSGLMHWSAMDANLEEVTAKMSLAEGHLARIVENTDSAKQSLLSVVDYFGKIIRDGIKVK